MPLPTPRKGEEQKAFIGRCIPLVFEREDLSKDSEKDRKQATAMCYSQWRKAHGGEKPEKFISYKDANDKWRWLAISNTAVLDKEEEIISEKAYDDAIQHARSTGEFGELDLVHVLGTDVGDCDLMLRLGNQLIEGGAWQDTKLAQRARASVSKEPDRWGVSIKFHFDPEQFDGKTYHGGIRIPKRTILPKEMAASHGTAIAVLGGNEMMKAIDEEAKAALQALGMEDEDIEALREKQKATPDENVKEKENDKQSVWKRFVQHFAPEQEKEQEPEIILEDEVVKTISEQAVKALMEVLAPIQKDIAALKPWCESVEQQVKALGERIEKTEGTLEDKVMKRLDSLPPIVKVRATEATVTETEMSATTTTNPFVEAVQDLVARALKES